MADLETITERGGLPATHGAAWQELSHASCTNGDTPHTGCDQIDALLSVKGLRGPAHQAAVGQLACSGGEHACAICPMRTWAELAGREALPAAMRGQDGN